MNFRHVMSILSFLICLKLVSFLTSTEFLANIYGFIQKEASAKNEQIATPLLHKPTGYECDTPLLHTVARNKNPFYQPCAVCYLPVDQAAAANPVFLQENRLPLKRLSFATAAHPSEKKALQDGKLPRFGGHPTWKDRAESFKIKRFMHVHCGFVDAEKPGMGASFNLSEFDMLEMEACKGLLVVSAILGGGYDKLQEPENVSERSKQEVCFFMFVDMDFWMVLEREGRFSEDEKRKVGIWRIVLIRSPPYEDNRRTGKVPKMLVHRLFPNVRHSIWIDGKMKLQVDPYQVVERFLWRENATFAISRNTFRNDVYDEAIAMKALKKHNGQEIDRQMRKYQQDGLEHFSEAKRMISDVPEGGVFLREHTLVTNLFSCLWFNEVDRFTPRDQLSFAYVRNKILLQVKWRYSMFLDCERCNFALLIGHIRNNTEQAAG